jgi:AraC family transcriptional regulator
MDKTNEYIERINRVIDYIELNIDRKIDLDMLAGVACLSKYHFHRIFFSFTDEPLYSYINRLRVERAAALLLTQKETITNIAFSCGFNDSATFSRTFKKRFKISPSAWKKKKNSKIDQEYKIKPPYIYTGNITTESIIKAAAIEEKTFQAMTIAYIRYTGPYAGNNNLFYSLHKKLIKWGQEKGLLNYPLTKDVIIYHDPLGITDENRLRISVGFTISDDVLVSGEIGKLSILKGRYIICRFELGNEEYGQAWTHVYRRIIPQRGLQPNDGYCFEMYPHNSYSKEHNTTSVDICVPVKQL